MMEFSDQDGVIVEIAAPVLSGAGGAARGPGAGGGAGELGRRLLAAARAGDTPAVLELMAAGAAFTADWLGTSPLHAAAAGAHHDTAAVLLRAGVSRDARTKVERTPLHDACAAGHARVARLLLAHGADPRAADMLRMTPLHWAAERGHADVVRLLLRHGAEPGARSKFMLTARELAARRGHRDLVHLLEEAERSAEHPARDLSPDDDPLSTPDRSESPPSAPARAGTQHLKGARAIGTERIEIKVEKPEPGGAAATTTAGRGSSGAAALLRAHGITLLPPDAGSTVLTALQSGRSVVLSDAGKLMLKESVAPTIVPTAPAGGGASTPAAAAAVRGTGGVVLRARQVRAAPPAGVKVFTVNNARALTKDTAPAIATADSKKTGSQDVQIKYVQLGVGGGSVVGKKLAPGGGGAVGAPGAVKFIMHKANFDKIIQQQQGGDVTVVAPTDPQTSAQQSQSAAAQLAVAQRTIATLSADLKQTKDELNLTREELNQTRNELKQTQKQLREYQDNELLK